MTTVSLDALLPYVSPSVPACPLETQRTAIRDAATEFLAATHIWREPLPLDFTQPGLAEYSLDPTPIPDTTRPPDDPAFVPVRVESVLWVMLAGHHLTGTDRRVSARMRHDLEGVPQFYWLVHDRMLRLYPTPEGVYEFYGELAIKPTRDSPVLPEWVVDDWADAITDGVLWRLMRTPQTAWTNMELAVFHRRRFDREKANAKTRSYRHVQMRVRPITFEG